MTTAGHRLAQMLLPEVRLDPPSRAFFFSGSAGSPEVPVSDAHVPVDVPVCDPPFFSGSDKRSLTCPAFWNIDCPRGRLS